MAAFTREVLNATGMKLRHYCAGTSKVGFGITGTWVGTATFRGSVDGVTFNTVNATPFASGTGVSTTTANGNWEINTLNYSVVEVEFTRTSGSMTVIIASAIDSSYQDAFLTAALQFVNSESTATNTLTQAAQANRAWCLKELLVSLAGPTWPSGSCYVAVYDGSITGTVLYKSFIEETAGSVGRRYSIDIPDSGITGTPGNAMTIRLFGPGATVTSEINAKFSAA